ncbi:hypothetical protein [Clostridium fungisolvens]|uniref:Uncharacterized protein n=1 Tax=Clostridium fungisolvens TaxID=1604897 RepID=A0A6V8SLW6_9CLOT|nr:hypothetical protein [Clostridium fungisolvens]GFP76168.1 hypothetical protein bsdtw1_02267 [Clostridium fungisolvens]
MNISKLFQAASLNNIYSSRQTQIVDTVSSATKTPKIQKPDAISSATKSKGGDHYFEARA